jgi:hypothetical protein
MFFLLEKIINGHQVMEKINKKLVLEVEISILLLQHGQIKYQWVDHLVV